MLICFRHLARACCPALLLCAATMSLNAQTAEWMKGVGGPGVEYGRFVEPTADGGFVVGGVITSESGSGLDDFWVARFDSEGEKLWENSYGFANTAHTIFTFNSARDGGFMIGGFTGRQGFGDESALMYKIDSVGNIVWEYNVDYNDSDHWHLLIERRNGGYYFGGHTDSKDDNSGDMWLVRLDRNRNIIWEKTYNRATPEHAHAGIETDDGGAFLLGHTTVSGAEKFWAVKVDSNGTKQWDKVLGSGPGVHDSPYDVFETREGNYAMVGGTSSGNLSQGWLIVVDSTGNIVIDKHYGSTAGSSFTWGGRQTRDGGFILSGNSNVRSKGFDDMYVVKTNPSGVLEWDRTYGGTGYDYGFDVVETPSGYIGVGFTSSPEIVTAGEADLMLVKIGTNPVLPATVVLSSPSNGSKGLVPAATAFNLSWSAASGATRYQVQISTDAAFSSLIHDDSTVTTTSTPPSGIAGTPAKYWWRVRARNANGWGPYSAAWTFETASRELPATVRLLAPRDGAVEIPAGVTLSWVPVAGSTRYHVQVATDSTFGALVKNDSSIATATLATADLPNANVKYWWRVRARNSIGWGPFSNVWTYSTSEVSSVDDDAIVGVNSIRVAPNPALTDATVALQLNRGGTISVSVIDARGTAVQTIVERSMPAGAHSFVLPVDNLSAGVYQLRVSRDGAFIASTRFTFVK